MPHVRRSSAPPSPARAGAVPVPASRAAASPSAGSNVLSESAVAARGAGRRSAQAAPRSWQGCAGRLDAHSPRLATALRSAARMHPHMASAVALWRRIKERHGGGGERRVHRWRRTGRTLRYSRPPPDRPRAGRLSNCSCSTATLWRLPVRSAGGSASSWPTAPAYSGNPCAAAADAGNAPPPRPARPPASIIREAPAQGAWCMGACRACATPDRARAGQEGRRRPSNFQTRPGQGTSCPRRSRRGPSPRPAPSPAGRPPERICAADVQGSAPPPPCTSPSKGTARAGRGRYRRLPSRPCRATRPPTAAGRTGQKSATGRPGPSCPHAACT